MEELRNVGIFPPNDEVDVSSSGVMFRVEAMSAMVFLAPHFVKNSVNIWLVVVVDDDADKTTLA